jgi:hypothetical protein
MRPVIPVGYPTRGEIHDIIKKHHPGLREKIEPLIETFWAKWATRRETTPPTPRDVIYVFNLAISLADFDVRNQATPLLSSRRDAPFGLERDGGAAVLEARYVERAFDELFETQSRHSS